MKDGKFAFKAEIRSCLEHSSRPTSTLWVNMMARGGQVLLISSVSTQVFFLKLIDNPSRYSLSVVKPEVLVTYLPVPFTRHPYTEPDEYAPHHIFVRCALILSSQLYPDLPNGLLSSDLMTKLLYAFLISFVYHNLILLYAIVIIMHQLQSSLL
jgi:hypothetical protein